eukprot:3247857-Rhodomonas_salina.1
MQVQASHGVQPSVNAVRVDLMVTLARMGVTRLQGCVILHIECAVAVYRPGQRLPLLAFFSLADQ